MRLSRFLVCWAALCVLGGTAARGASIAWGPATAIAGDSDINTAGSLVAAFNIGDPSVSGTTINGVTFAAFPIINNTQSTTLGALTVSTVTPGITSTTPLGSASAPFTSLSTSYQALLSAGAVKASPPVVDANFSGLTIGNVYTVQLWANNSQPNSNVISASGSGDFVALDPNTTNVEGGVGQYVVGTFTATAATQNINLTGSLPLLNGIQLRTAVPEPMMAGLFAWAATVFWGWRGRRRES